MKRFAVAALLAALAPLSRASDADDALAARDAGRLEDARAGWVKASSAEDADGFVWAQRGWSELAVGKMSDARTSFERAVNRAGSSGDQAEARLGAGLALLLSGKLHDADEALRLAGLAGPYQIATSSRLRAEAALARGDDEAARTHLRQALELDSYDLVSLRRLMLLFARQHAGPDAWRAAERVLRMDPADAEASRILESSARGVKGDRDAALGLRRATRPLLSPDDDSTPLPVSTRMIRVALYAADSGRPTPLAACMLLPNAAYRVVASSGDAARASGAFGEARRVEFDPATRRIEVRDVSRNLLFSTRSAIRFEPLSPRGSVLISTASPSDPAPGVDRGDREMRGTIVVHPAADGFTLVAESPLEQYLYGVVSVALPDGAPEAALEAQAVVARTRAARAAMLAGRDATFDVADSGDLRTIGVSGELRSATSAVAATDGIVMESDGAPIDAAQTSDSGGWTDAGVADGTQVGPLPTAGLALERYLHDPPAGIYSAESPAAAPSATRWTLVLDERDLRARLARRADLGRIRSVRVSRRSASGRVLELIVEGRKSALTLSGRVEIQQFLSPGSLRSTLFSLQPINDGKRLARLVVWGAGTGEGRGFARAGALGQAASGADWRAILARYFPDATLSSEARKK